MARIDFLNPAAEGTTPTQPYLLKLSDEKPSLVFGLLANNFPDSDTFLDHLEVELEGLIPNATFRRYAKPGEMVGSSVPASDEQLDQIVGECDAVVTAWGH